MQLSENFLNVFLIEHWESESLEKQRWRDNTDGRIMLQCAVGDHGVSNLDNGDWILETGY